MVKEVQTLLRAAAAQGDRTETTVEEVQGCEEKLAVWFATHHRHPNDLEGLWEAVAAAPSLSEALSMPLHTLRCDPDLNLHKIFGGNLVTTQPPTYRSVPP